MSVKAPAGDGSTPKIAKAALYLGIGSLAALVLSIIGGFMVESFGIINLFRSIVMPLSLAAIFSGLIARKKIAEEGLLGHRAAALGLLLGIITLVLVIFTIIGVAALFLPLLFV